MKELTSMIRVAEIHTKRLKYAISRLASKIPVTAEVMEALPDEDMLIFELYSSRFTKLQDFMGSSLFPAALEIGEELEDTMSLVDKLHKLEKMGLIISADNWVVLRKIRNNLTHEYPDNPELAALFFNKAYLMGEELLENLDLILKFIKSKLK